MISPFAKLRAFHGAPPVAPGVVVDSVDRGRSGDAPLGSYVPLAEAAVTLGIKEPDLEYFVRTRKVRFLRAKKHRYFKVAELWEDLATLTEPTGHSGGR